LRAILIAVSAGLLLSSLAFSQETAVLAPKLLLTTQRLRRLERDHTRQTVRWLNFENRVNTVPDSPERGFELALYYAATHDVKRGREAVDWALAHKCERRQVALVSDWCAGLISADEKQALATTNCAIAIIGRPPSASKLIRDSLFEAIARGNDVSAAAAPGWKQVLTELQDGKFADGQMLYAACEYLTAIRATQHVDLRQDDPQFFLGLPVELLLSLKPGQVQHPDWMTHIAALALIALDPNSESSQFLQGWAIEDRQMLREGAGVAYELLWADPYLPGVGYQNLDPWTYDANGRLFARASWNSDSCWIAISSGAVQQENCPAGWQNVSNPFGHMTLTPMSGRCTEVPRRKNNNDSVVLWRLQPRQKVIYFSQQRKEPVEADAAGMWRLPQNVEGRVCISLDKLKRP